MTGTGMLLSALLWLSATGCGMMAGLYFAFSAFIMRALAGIDRTQGIAAMNAINVEILKSWFMPLFYGTTLASLVLAGLGCFRLGTPGALPMLGGGLIYFLGMFVVTILFNVPLNNALAAGGAGSEQLWAHFVRRWTLWNHVRTLTSTVACVLFILSLTTR